MVPFLICAAGFLVLSLGALFWFLIARDEFVTRMLELTSKMSIVAEGKTTDFLSYARSYKELQSGQAKHPSLWKYVETKHPDLRKEELDGLFLACRKQEVRWLIGMIQEHHCCGFDSIGRYVKRLSEPDLNEVLSVEDIALLKSFHLGRGLVVSAHV